MISLQYNQIPAFLHKSAFYESLNGESSDSEGQVIQIPERCFKENDQVTNLEEFGQLLHTMQFWGVDVIPDGMIEFLNDAVFQDWKPLAIDVLDSKSPLLADLLTIYENPTARSSITDGVVLAEQARWVVRKNRSEVLAHWLAEVWYKTRMKSDFTDITDFAAKCGSLDCLQILLRNNFSVTHNTALLASQNGHLDCLRFLREHNCPCDNSVLVAAAEEGHLDVLMYAHEQKMEWDSQVCTAAASKGHLHCLRYAHEHGCPWTDEVTEEAADNDHFDCLKYALEHGCDISIETSINATSKGHLDCLQLLHQFNAPWDIRVSNMAARYGHLHILQYLYEHNFPWNASLFENAVAGGHLHCIEYMHSQGLTFPAERYELCELAARHGHLNILKYFHENRVPWNENTVYRAVQNSHLNVVQYAIAQGCDWDCHACTNSAVHFWNNDKNILKYLLSKWTPSQDQLCNYAFHAAREPRENMLLQYLVEEHHCNLSDIRVFSAALASGHLAYVQCCFEKGCREVHYITLCDTISVRLFWLAHDEAVLQCVKYLVEQGWEIPVPFMQFVQRFKAFLPKCEAYYCFFHVNDSYHLGSDCGEPLWYGL